MIHTFNRTMRNRIRFQDWIEKFFDPSKKKKKKETHILLFLPRSCPLKLIPFAQMISSESRETFDEKEPVSSRKTALFNPD